MIGEFRALAQRGARGNVLLWVAGEIFIVVAGVLIAFGLNAWWVERSARIEEQTHLRALARDFEQNVGIYDELHRSATRKSSTRASSSCSSRASSRTPTPRLCRPLLGQRILSRTGQKPALDAYRGARELGGAHVDSRRRAAAALAGFADRAIDPYHERFADQLYLDVHDALRRSAARSRASWRKTRTEPESYAELLSDPGFQEHLAYPLRSRAAKSRPTTGSA